MATITTILSAPSQASGTFSTIDSGKAVFTTTTLLGGQTLTTTQPWAAWVDSATATTIRVPLQDLLSVV